MDRETRALKNLKASFPTIVRRKPSPSEGFHGDIAIGNTADGIKLFVKIGGRWYTFSSDTVASKDSSVVNFTPSTDGTVAAPSKILSSSDSGKTFVVNISANTAVFQLPPVSNLGANFKFVLSHASNDEGTKDFAIITSVIGEDIIGNIMVAGAVVEIAGISTVQIDTTDGNATYGDWISVFSDGSYWYIDGSIVTSGVDDTNAGHVLDAS
jgi:hypothetical protein